MGILDPYTELKPQKNKALGGPALEAHDLACVRGDRSLFSQLRFTLELGSALIVEGRNGSGKTSLLRIVCGLLRADHGEVRWRGELIREVREEYYKDLAYIGHLHGLKGELTPLENLRVAQALAATTPRTSPEKALAHMELEPFSLLPCRDLSLGQRRRVALARLLMSPASLWILDEPLAGIDRLGVERVEALFRDHLDLGGALILSSHQPLSLQQTGFKSLHLG
ncbi:MAG: cytochrome c biogenesis heme-transporting ATPase CcmA [Gammaproteobacteria bacterium]